MSLQNIPSELRALPQWVCAGEDKHPLNPRTGQPASVIDPTTWATFQEAVDAGYYHIGFVLSPSDPYAIVDLDDPTTVKVNGIVYKNPDLEEVQRIAERHRKILEAFESYAEISQSGTGIHIVVRGKVTHGAKRQKVELYSESRYMIFTGNVIKNLAITDQQPLVTALFKDMSQEGLTTTELSQVKSHLSDEELYNIASTAENADKFLKLWRGDWQGVAAWPSQSEADFALLAMLGFYSPDNEQVRRVFRYSALGKRDKAVKNDKYLNYALSKIRAKTPPPVDFSALLERGSATAPLPGFETIATAEPAQQVSVETSEAPQEIKADTLNLIEFPPGFVGELAQYIFSSAIRPVPEIALCAAIAVTAGVIGRAFNISGQGLNQYLILLAPTGTGKEGAATGIDAIVSAVRPTVPMIDEFIGPGAFASGQALVRVLDKNPCFVSVLGEFGLTLQAMCAPNANPALVSLKKVLLDIYNKSGHNRILAKSVYSDTDKNTKTIVSPNVTIFGESNPVKFYEGLDLNIISEGLLPRFSIFEYDGLRPDTNPNAFGPPPEPLVRFFGSLAAVAMQAQQNRACSPVQQDPKAAVMMREFDKRATKEINVAQMEVSKLLWTRAHVKALKMAALIAVGVNPHQPIINEQIAGWAIRLICRDVEKLLQKFESGEIGSGDVRLELDVRRAIDAYLKMSPTDRRGYQCPDKMAKFQLVPLQYLRRRLRLLVNFKSDKRGANRAMTDTLNAMVEGELLVRLSPQQCREQCGTTSPVYGIGPAW